MKRKIHVMVLGLRGFPNVQGGVETHAEHLYPIVSDLGCAVDVIVRTPYVAAEIKEWHGVKLRRLWSPTGKGIEALVHSFLGTLYAAIRRPDVLHVHAIGPALVTPLARLLGLRVVVTHHGPDYDREKWGAIAKSMLVVGEWCGMKFANQRIVISNTIRELVQQRHGCDSIVIPNGVTEKSGSDTKEFIEELNLKRNRYVLIVSRMVPEKRHADLIRAFEGANLHDWKLVIVGAIEKNDSYCRSILDLSKTYPNIIMTGFRSDNELDELYQNAGIFVLPSSHEGLPIALLEALSYGLPSLASDIPANKEIGLGSEHYFPLGDVGGLSTKIVSFAEKGISEEDRDEVRKWVIERYNWTKIAEQTIAVYDLATSDRVMGK